MQSSVTVRQAALTDSSRSAWTMTVSSQRALICPSQQLHLAAERPIKILGSMAGFAAYFLVQVHNLLAGNSKQY